MQHHVKFLNKTQRLWAFFLLPVINITALFLCDPLYENITHIVYAKQQLPFVIIWVLSFTYYLWCTGIVLTEKLSAHKKSCRCLLLLCCLLMVISVIIPYHNQADILAKLHVRLAMLATISYNILFFYLLCQLFYNDFTLKKMLSCYISFIAAECLLFLLTGCISALMETSYVIFMGIFLYVLLKKVFHTDESV